MTSTPAPSDARRLLRVGIVHSHRIVEERLLARAAGVTIGTSPRNTFVVPWDDVPMRWRLFEERGGRRFLRLAPEMTARIAAGDAVTSVDADVPGGSARPIPLTDRARGKVTIGETTVLFQLLRPQSETPRPQLPIHVRRRLVAELDRLFTAILLFTIALHAALLVYLRQVDWPRHPALDEVPDRFIRQLAITPRPRPPAHTPVAAETPAPRKIPPAHTSATPGPRSPRPARPIVAGEKPDVSRLGLIPLLTARSADGQSSINDVLSGGAVERSLDEAMRGVGGIDIAANDGLRGMAAAGVGHGKIATPTDLRAGGRIVDAGPAGPVTEREVGTRVKLDGPILEGGQADLAAITREIRARRKAIAACYERALKTRPTLAGKLVVRFSITAAGTISAVDIDDDTLAAPEVAACVRALVLRWRFPPPTEAPVELSFPFVFQAGS